MKFKHKEFVDKEREKLVRKYIIAITLVTMCPAIYLTYGIVKETFFHSAANSYISEELQFPDSQILSREISYPKREIKVVMVGNEVSEDQIAAARQKLEKYNLKETKLVVFQGGNNGEMDISNIKSMVMEDFYKKSEQKLALRQHEVDSLKTLLDCLQMVGAITDDKLCFQIEAEKRIDKYHPRVEFALMEVNEQKQIFY